jgi:hypothetical protein
VNNSRGSIWRKWDLHVHTPASIYQCFGIDEDQTWENYISDLEKLPTQFAVVGINDYIFLNGYERLKKAQEKLGRIPNLILLPVVEFRIEKFAGVQFGPLKRINLHVIFSDDVTLETIQSQFLNTLEQSYSLDSGDKWARAITPESVEELGKHIKSTIPAAELHKYGSDIIEGFNNLNVSEAAIFKSLEKDCFKDKHLIAIGKTEWGELKWSESSIAEKKSIINKAHLVFTAAESVNAFNKAKKQLTDQRVNDLLLDCSDAHYLSSSTDKDRIGNCNTWIKANPTFEGLRQILFEPEQRLKIQGTEPDFKEEKLLIDEVRFISLDGTFSPIAIKLNKNLNVIIGGKSSGKSILLFNIARTLLTDRSNKGPLKFMDTGDNKYKYLYDFGNDLTKFDFQVTLKSGSQQSIHRADNEPSILADIKYIPQNHLSNLVDRSRRQGNTLKTLIRGLILEEESCNNAYANFLDKVKLNDVQRNRLIDDYFQLKDKIGSQEQDIMLKGDQAALTASILKNQQQIKILNEDSGLTPTQITEYDRYNVELNELNITQSKIVNDYRKLSTLQEELKTTLSVLEQKKLNVLESLEIDEIRKEFSVTYNFITTAVNSLLETEKLLQLGEQNTIVNDSSIRRTLNKNAQRKAEIEVLLKPLRLNQESKIQISTLEKSIQEDQQKLSVVQQLQAEILINKQTLTQKQESIFDAFSENFKEYENIITVLDPRVKSIEGEDDKLEIKGLAKFNFPKLKVLIEEITDLREVLTLVDYLYLVSPKQHSQLLLLMKS